MEFNLTLRIIAESCIILLFKKPSPIKVKSKALAKSLIVKNAFLGASKAPSKLSSIFLAIYSLIKTLSENSPLESILKQSENFLVKPTP